MVHVKTPNQPEIPDIAALRCGVQRDTMRTNALIHRAGDWNDVCLLCSAVPLVQQPGIDKISLFNFKMFIVSFYTSTAGAVSFLCRCATCCRYQRGEQDRVRESSDGEGVWSAQAV